MVMWHRRRSCDAPSYAGERHLVHHERTIAQHEELDADRSHVIQRGRDAASEFIKALSISKDPRAGAIV